MNRDTEHNLTPLLLFSHPSKMSESGTSTPDQASNYTHTAFALLQALPTMHRPIKLSLSTRRRQ